MTGSEHPVATHEHTAACVRPSARTVGALPRVVGDVDGLAVDNVLVLDGQGHGGQQKQQEHVVVLEQVFTGRSVLGG